MVTHVLALSFCLGMAATQPPTATEPPPNPASQASSLVHLIELKGRVGIDFNGPLLKSELDRAAAAGAKLIILDIDSQSPMPGKDPIVATERAQRSAEFNDIYSACAVIAAINQLRSAETAARHPPALVAWVHRALGPIAAAPFGASVLILSPEGRWGGLDAPAEASRRLRGETNYDQKREMSYSLRRGRLEGLAMKFGHEPRIIRAMTSKSYTLSVSFTPAGPVYFEDNTGDLLLSDDANPAKGHEDSLDELREYRGNDLLILDASTALKLKEIAGICDSLDEVLRSQGLDPASVTIDREAAGVLARRRAAIVEASAEIATLMTTVAPSQITGATLEDRSQQRRAQIDTLNHVIALRRQFEDALGPGLGGGPTCEIDVSDLDLRIEVLKQQARTDK